MKYIQLFQKKVIERTKDVPYLVRWNLFGLGEDSKYFSIKVHKIVASDEECLHDHPWAFVSIILWGGYTETTTYHHRQDGHLWTCMDWNVKLQRWLISRQFNPISIIYRPANWFHRLTVTKPCWTLVFTFAKTRHWGFLTPSGLKHWSKYNRETDC